MNQDQRCPTVECHSARLIPSTGVQGQMSPDGIVCPPISLGAVSVTKYMRSKGLSVHPE